MRILHIVRDHRDGLPLEVARSQGGEHEVAILFIQNGVLARAPEALESYALAQDLEARGLPPRGKMVDFPGMVRLIVEADRALVW